MKSFARTALEMERLSMCAGLVTDINVITLTGSKTVKINATRKKTALTVRKRNCLKNFTPCFLTLSARRKEKKCKRASKDFSNSNNDSESMLSDSSLVWNKHKWQINLKNVGVSKFTVTLL